MAPAKKVADKSTAKKRNRTSATTESGTKEINKRKKNCRNVSKEENDKMAAEFVQNEECRSKLPFRLLHDGDGGIQAQAEMCNTEQKKAAGPSSGTGSCTQGTSALLQTEVHNAGVAEIPDDFLSALVDEFQNRPAAEVQPLKPERGSPDNQTHQMNQSLSLDAQISLANTVIDVLELKKTKLQAQVAMAPIIQKIASLALRKLQLEVNALESGFGVGASLQMLPTTNGDKQNVEGQSWQDATTTNEIVTSEVGRTYTQLQPVAIPASTTNEIVTSEVGRTYTQLQPVAIPAYSPGQSVAIPAYSPGQSVAIPAYSPGQSVAIPAYSPGQSHQQHDSDGLLKSLLCGTPYNTAE